MLLALLRKVFFVGGVEHKHISREHYTNVNEFISTVVAMPAIVIRRKHSNLFVVIEHTRLFVVTK